MWPSFLWIEGVLPVPIVIEKKQVFQLFDYCFGDVNLTFCSTNEVVFFFYFFQVKRFTFLPQEINEEPNRRDVREVAELQKPTC